MGPNDPFETAEPRQSRSDEAPSAFSEWGSGLRAPQPATVRRLALLLGLALGVLFGILVLAYSFTGALLVYLLGGLGAFLGWFGHGIATQRFDVGAAWRALRRRDLDRMR